MGSPTRVRGIWAFLCCGLSEPGTTLQCERDSAVDSAVRDVAVGIPRCPRCRLHRGAPSLAAGVASWIHAVSDLYYPEPYANLSSYRFDHVLLLVVRARVQAVCPSSSSVYLVVSPQAPEVCSQLATRLAFLLTQTSRPPFPAPPPGHVCLHRGRLVPLGATRAKVCPPSHSAQWCAGGRACSLFSIPRAEAAQFNSTSTPRHPALSDDLTFNNLVLAAMYMFIDWNKQVLAVADHVLKAEHVDLRAVCHLYVTVNNGTTPAPAPRVCGTQELTALYRSHPLLPL